jgi:hypothetical protein
MTSPITEEDVRNGYRWLLGRAPESQATIAAHLESGLNWSDFRARLLNGPEFTLSAEASGLFDRIGDFRHGPDSLLPEDHLRRIFLRIPLTGSDQMMRLFRDGVARDVLCPEKNNDLWLRSAVDLAAYGAFAGYFDRASLRMIPGRERLVLVMLSDPRQRLIALHRHLRAYDDALVEAADLTLCRLAKAHGLAQFLTLAAEASPGAVDNTYLRALGGTLPRGRWEASPKDPLPPFDAVEAMDAAKTFIDSAHVGFFEDLHGARLDFAQALGLPDAGDPLRERHDDAVYQGRYDWSPAEAFDPAAEPIIDRLTAHDQVLYDYARHRS